MTGYCVSNITLMASAHHLLALTKLRHSSSAAGGHLWTKAIKQCSSSLLHTNEKISVLESYLDLN